MRWKLLMLAGVVATAACREADRPGPPVYGALVAVDSDPRGARIFVERQQRAQVTPDTLSDVPIGRREIGARLDSMGVPYGFAELVEVPEEGIVEVFGPLLFRCTVDECFRVFTKYRTANTIRFATSPTGHLFYIDGTGGGLFWPAETQNSYVAGGGAAFAGVWGTTSTPVALGPYSFGDQFGNWAHYLAGRPAPEVNESETGFSLRQTTWVLPPGIFGLYNTVRGLEIEQEVIGRHDVEGVLLVRLTYRNISSHPAYRQMDPQPAEGGTYTDAYIAFALDADIGEAEDDLVSYDPDLGLVFMYDAQFREGGFQGGWANRPALVGVRVLEAPAGLTPILTAWPRSEDWYPGTVSESNGWGWLAGQQDQSRFPRHPDARIGYAPTVPDDYRIVASVGPLRLMPGDAASLTVAVVIAEPEPGTFVSGQTVPPGDPLDPNRQILRVAEGLRQRAIAAEELLDLLPARR
ncbi:MAG: hypothetical protein DIU52_003445 [bacterium]|mgnify:FL=1|jgi:hypothetical protein|nr:MAG: hypothetical protein DIU52_09280 [bacterium]